MPSFDIVSKVDLQEVRNAINQTLKEVRQRYDFKGIVCSIELKEREITVISGDEFKIKNLIEILITKLAKRSVPQKALHFGQIERAVGGKARVAINIQDGMSKDNARLMIKYIKELKLKVQSQIMENQLRVTGKKKDDLQEVIQHIKEKELDFDVQFTNYR